MFKPNEKYKVKVQSAGLADSEKGPQPYVVFEGLNGEGTITYYGNMGSDKAQEFTVKNLITAGFTGSDLSDLENPMMFKSVDLSIETEEYKGKTRIKYINKAYNGPKKFVGQAPKMASVFARVRQSLGDKTPVGKVTEPDVF